MSQTTEILNHLKRGRSITPLESLHKYGVLRLAARIQELLDQGHKIATVPVTQGGKRFARYKLIRGRR